jgi:hypothetical protein
MADSDAHTGYGALLQRGDGASPENFVTILGVKSITGPNFQRGTHDTTTNDRAATSNFREFIGGLVDGGEISFDANFLPRDETQGQSTGFLSEFDKSSCDSRGRWRILFPECEGEAEGYMETDAIVTGAQMTLPMDDIMGFAGTLKVSGRPELVLVTG